MNTCELVKEILKYICEEDYKIIINKVCFQGFIVPGLEHCKNEKKWRPPVEVINNDIVLNKKIRKGGKYNYQMLFDTMLKMAKDRNDPDSILYKVMEWEEYPESRPKIEAFFKELEDDEQEDQKVSESEEQKESSNKEDNGVNKDLKEQIEIQKKNIRKYKEERQILKIKNSNLEQENHRLKKESQRFNKESEKNKIAKKSIEKELNERIIALSVENSRLKAEIKKMKETKEHTIAVQPSAIYQPKILCVAKNCSDIMIEGYDIYFLTDLKERNNKVYKTTVFDQIWYIREGFTHADLIKIADQYPDQSILQAKSWKLLQKKIEGAGVLL